MATVIDAPAPTVGDEQDPAAQAKWFNSANDMLAQRLPNMVKGAGFAQPGGNRPLDDPKEILDRAFEANQSIRRATSNGLRNPHAVFKGLNPAFSQQFGMFMGASGAPGFGGGGGGLQDALSQVQQALADLGKNVTLTSPLTSGFVPYDLVNPSRLIYPVYSPLRNKIPRVPGQGTSRKVKVITGVSGSQTSGGSGGGTGRFVDISQAETTNFGTWPNALPNAGAQSAVDVDVPYRFLGMSESLSWLAQFSGQGFEDISALANLILLQEFMLSEEAMIIAGTPTAITAPTTTVTTALRTPGSNESGVTAAHLAVVVTAANYYGETASTASFSTDVVPANQVVDVTLPQNLPPGALWWNIYVSTNVAPTRANAFLAASGVGGNKFTLQGTMPSSGPTAPAADSGTNGANRLAGILPTLEGQLQGAPYPSGSGWLAGYYRPKAGARLGITIVNDMLAGLWTGDATYGTGFGAFKADPSELIGEGGDIRSLADAIVQAGQATNYRLAIDQGEVAGVRAGVAVSEFQNPITRSIVRLLVHPWWPQGTVVGMSYQLPYSWTNVNNVWEMSMVQDYLSISWPVIDPTFRYSMFAYGNLVCQAPQYCGVVTGLQKNDQTPFS